jgi:hypothetical protein
MLICRMLRLLLVVIVIVGLSCASAGAQECPREGATGPSVASVPRSLTGLVVYHDELRQWLELKLDTPVCGVHSVQLLRSMGAFEVDEGNARKLEMWRGCHITTRGPLGVPGTGYYSADQYQDVTAIRPSADCVKKTPLPDYSHAKPATDVRSYQVTMHLDYAARGGHIDVQVRSGRRALQPWQAYASYWLTGGYVFYGNCADNFNLSSLNATSQAHPSQTDNQAEMDPESAAAAGVKQLNMSFSCRKASSKKFSSRWRGGSRR